MYALLQGEMEREAPLLVIPPRGAKPL